MAKISKMRLRDIIDEFGLILRQNDIIYFCKDIEVMKEFIERYAKGPDNPAKKEDVEKFLIDNEDSIDKEKLVLLITYNYKENLILINNRIEYLKKQYKDMDSADVLKELSRLYAELSAQKESLETAMELGKGIEEFITFYYYDDKENRFRVKVVDSREVIDNKGINISKPLKRYNEIDRDFRNVETDETGIEYVLQSLLLTDLYKVFPTEAFGNDIRTMILENQVLIEKIKTKEELEELKSAAFSKGYESILDDTEFDNILPNVKETLREYVQYLDIDTLLLLSAYRFEEGLESGFIDSEASINAKTILQGILKNIKDKSLQFTGNIQRKRDKTYVEELVTYSIRDIKTCLSRFTNNTYLSSEKISEYREMIGNGEINLLNIQSDYIDVIFSQEELEKISTISIENLIYAYYRFDWDTSKVVNLYISNEISIEDVRKIKETIDLTDGISFEQLNSYYQQINENPENKEALDIYKKYLDLYKEIFINDNEQNKIEENANLILEKLVETLEGKEYEETVKNYYKEGIITLNSIVEWSNKDFIIELFDEGLISLEDMNQLVIDEKLPIEDLNNIYANLIKNEDMEYDERLGLIKSGFVREEDIFELYKQNLIFEKDLEELADKQIILKERMKEIVNNRTKAELESHSSIRLTGLNTLTKKNNDIYSYGGYTIGLPGQTKLTGRYIIDPNERAKFIDLLKAYRADTDLNEDSPFYNYEFYVIPDESKTIGLNSVVIAERYFEDKDTQRKFAMNNATYFFKYKDLMVLSNLRKSEMTKERKNIVFTSNHVIANEKRDGRWAASVISSIVKTMLSSDLKQYNRKNQRKIILKKLEEMYSTEELVDIIGRAAEIDKGEYICEIEETIADVSQNDISDEER